MPTFHLLNFGCRASQADGAAMKRQLLNSGLAESAQAENCEIAVLNTCTVTSAADAEVRQIIRRIHRSNPQCRIMVTGCYAQRSAQEIAELSGVEWVVGNSHKHLVAKVLGGRQKSEARSKKPEENRDSGLVRINLPDPEIPTKEEADLQSRITNPGPRATVLVGEIAEEFHFAPVFPDDMTRPTLKVQDGCDSRCSFCIIPEVRGPSRSLKPEIVIAQVRELDQKGYKEIVLSGINLGRYGKDLERRVTLPGLVERILDETSMPRIRISSIEPMDVTPELIRLVATEPRMARHFHIPLQSGCDHTLRAMNRRYWASHYAERIWAVLEQIPHCGIGADVMVGFPGETHEDHQTSLRFIESLPFTYLHVFPYSSRPGTPAAKRTDHLNGRIIHERGQEIRNVATRKRQEFMESQIGLELSAVTLADRERGAPVALTTNYLKLLLPESGVTSNVLVNVKIGRVHGGALYGYVGAPPALCAPTNVMG
ncbi:MAG: tRNA (N(6)-L-threonylcarbamoyladenosine(37)-C(2))-methylthiotransferase MtaB [Acidobacteria bacterium]|nr:tRNA (N(6)-L-threonylcarbamoyladenosine(37)-C(2))-methylthiotransferase MtaB [Acidobacteriota bacterium]